MLRRLAKSCALASVATVLAQEDACASAPEAGQCAARGKGAVPKNDHLLIQRGARAVARQGANASAPGDFDSGSCLGMPDVKQSCSTSGCKVLAHTDGRSCTQYCQSSGRSCVAAWEEVADNCDVQYGWQCDDPLPGTSDLLCECDLDAGAIVGEPTLPEMPSSSLVWSDEFDGYWLDSSKWSHVHAGGGFGNSEKQFYTRSNTHLSNGVLSITAKCQEHHGHHFTSAKLTTHYHAHWGPGHRVDVRAKLPQGKGTWPAIWMLPIDKVYGEWPRSGEIDIMEAVGCTANRIYGTIHTEAYNHMKHTEKYSSLATSVGDWHTYSLVWEAHQLRWYVDGVHFHSFVPSSFESAKWPFDQQFYLILNLAVGGSWGGQCVHGTPSCHKWDEFQQDQVMQVDFARVYKL
uniref:GH16 domain-containing protein n=1 Tax=Zooxanthella nutricula TaxID=1333877 RepID=A0A6U6N125_9DINO